ncbi:hypothetical protein Sjap_006020 [Stephania japonica]|uniref:Uncharacterized protein n=1 Tax=Stephania japonica TaxID=461633 RepID=A0AAP0K7K1_9MAGN
MASSFDWLFVAFWAMESSGSPSARLSSTCPIGFSPHTNGSRDLNVKITYNICGVSCTGEGEAIIRGTLVRDVAAVMEYKGLKLQVEVDWVVKNRLDGQAGCYALGCRYVVDSVNSAVYLLRCPVVNSVNSTIL